MSTVQARAGYIAANELHPALKFEFKPLDYEGRAKIDKATHESQGNPEKWTLVRCSAIKNQLASWEANQSHLFSHVPGDPPGDALPLTVSSIRQVIPVLVDKLFYIVMGGMASDPVPGASEEETSDLADTIIKAAAEGVSAGSAAAEREAGN